MICSNCGKNIKKGSRFCNYCGQGFSVEENAAKQDGKNSKKKLALMITAAVAALALLAGLMYGFVSGVFAPRENNIYNKDSYSVSDKKANANREKIVATVGNLELSNGLLQVFYGMQYINYMNSEYAYYVSPDVTKPLHKQVYDEESGMTWQQFFLDAALTTWMRYSVLTDEAYKMGFTLPKDVQKLYDSTEATLLAQMKNGKYESLDEMVQADFGAGCTFEDYMRYQELYYYGNMYFSDMVNKLEITDAEVNAYFNEHEKELSANGITKTSGLLVDVRHILFQPANGKETSPGNVEYSEKDWEAAHEEAQKVYDMFMAGDETEEYFSDLAMKYSDDSNASAGGLYTFVSKGRMVEAFDSWCFAEGRQAGDVGMVRTKFGYHIIYYVTGDDGWVRYCQSGIRQEKSAELLEQKTDNVIFDVQYKNIVLGEAQLGN